MGKQFNFVVGKIPNTLRCPNGSMLQNVKFSVTYKTNTVHHNTVKNEGFKLKKDIKSNL